VRARALARLAALAGCSFVAGSVWGVVAVVLLFILAGAVVFVAGVFVVAVLVVGAGSGLLSRLWCWRVGGVVAVHHLCGGVGVVVDVEALGGALLGTGVVGGLHSRRLQRRR